MSRRQALGWLLVLGLCGFLLAAGAAHTLATFKPASDDTRRAQASMRTQIAELEADQAAMRQRLGMKP